MNGRKRLLFVSPRFLFPADSGGKIRTSQILRGMRGGRFHITLASPVPRDMDSRFSAELGSVADEFVGWPETVQGPLFPITRMRHILSPLPIPVATDRSKEGRATVQELLRKSPDLAVFDFLHSAVLAPGKICSPSILFTHNVESEIFHRHAVVTRNPLKRSIWSHQWKKMETFEMETLRRFQTVIAVSEKDASFFTDRFGVRNVSVISTGVDLDYYAYSPPGESHKIVFTGAMDWLANIDAMEYMMDEVWPSIAASIPDVSMTVVGRNPPRSLADAAKDKGIRWEFTGFVDDVRPYVRNASVYVIPLRVGGGTRIKAYEAMAMGCPVVSTSIGVEGLPVEDGSHFRRADTPSEILSAVLGLIRDREARETLSAEARRLVEENFSSKAVAKEFEDICFRVAENPIPREPLPIG